MLATLISRNPRLGNFLNSETANQIHKLFLFQSSLFLIEFDRLLLKSLLTNGDLIGSILNLDERLIGQFTGA